MTTPYNTGRVQIGLLYQPSLRRTFTRDEQTIQNALLSRKAQIDWDGVAIVGGCTVALAALVLWKWLS